MNEKKTVTVAGVPVTVTVAGWELAVQVGRFDPQAAAGRLRINSLSGTGLLAECQDGCPHGDLDHDGLCLRDSPEECQWCGTHGRLHEVPRASVERRLPTVGEEGEGLWHLQFTDGAQGPFPSAQAAWDYWHGNGCSEAPGPSEGKPREAS